jgi:hypothetical protein
MSAHMYVTFWCRNYLRSSVMMYDVEDTICDFLRRAFTINLTFLKQLFIK